MVSEFASYGHAKLSPREYEPYFRDLLEVFRERPYVVGAAVWTYNDYRSRYSGTESDGYRHYGAVTAERKPKATYELFASEFSPAVIRDGSATMDGASGGGVVVSSNIHAREDFPSYPLCDYGVRCQVLGSNGDVLDTRTIGLPVLKPGNKYPLNTTFRLESSARPAIVRIEVVRPTGFVTTAKDFHIAP